MIRTLAHVPIGRKLLVIGLATTGLTLIVLATVLIARGALEWRSRTLNDLETYSAMIGWNAAPAVMFDDARAAGDTLSALSATPSIVYGAIHDRAGRLFATYRPAGAAPGEVVLLEAPPAGFASSATSLALSRPLTFKGEPLGTLTLQADLSEMYGKLARDAGWILVAALLAFSAGTFLLLRLQRAIVEPITGLANAMRGVSERQNYGLRVPVTAGDEVGVLSLAFNSMLDRLQGRDAELAQHRDRLEAEVARRTAELEQANRRLEQELRERERAEAALQRSSRQGDLLNHMVATLQTCLSQEEVATVVTPFIARLFPGSSGTVYLLKSSRNLLEAAAPWGAAPPKNAVFAPNDCWAIRRGQLHVASPVETAPRCPHGDGHALCEACAPMLAQGEMLGILHAECAEATPDDAALLQRVAGEIAQALANLRYREALKRMAIRDPLTGLFNRRYLEEYLEMEIARCTRKGTQLALLLADIDHFKRFNDSFGHEAGDEILREVGQLFTRHTRDGDAACRYGGEEFVIAMWECAPESARARAEQLRQDIKQLEVRLGQRPLGPVTLSAGVAVFPDHGGTAEAVLRAADRALYTAKLGGRDRVSMAAGDATPSASSPRAAGA